MKAGAERDIESGRSCLRCILVKPGPRHRHGPLLAITERDAIQVATVMGDFDRSKIFKNGIDVRPYAG